MIGSCLRTVPPIPGVAAEVFILAVPTTITRVLAVVRGSAEAPDRPERPIAAAAEIARTARRARRRGGVFTREIQETESAGLPMGWPRRSNRTISGVSTTM